jgi:Xaa-Pro dipeptidase
MTIQKGSRIEKLNAIKKAKNIDAFLLTSPASVKYFTGYFFSFETGPSPFHLLPAALAVANDSASLIIADNETSQLSSLAAGISVKPYSSYVYESAPDFVNQFLAQLEIFFIQHHIKSGRIGIELNAIPLAIVQAITDQYPRIGFVDVFQDVNHFRLFKDADEIEFIRKAANLCDIGQAAVLKYAKTGMTELELFELVRGKMEKYVGARFSMMADFVSGVSTASGGGGPTNKLIQEGDLILTDLTPCLQGYWGDSCATIIIGEPTAEQKETFKLVREALDIGINAIRPGVQAKEIDRLMRNHIGNYPHHSGHGVGIMYHEEPRIVPYNDIQLLPNMVIALEPAIYKEDYGIRLEHLVVVTETGCELLTKFEHCFEQSM